MLMGVDRFEQLCPVRRIERPAVRAVAVAKRVIRTCPHIARQVLERIGQIQIPANVVQ